MTTKRVTIRLPEESHTALKAQAAALGKRPAALAAQYVKAGIDAYQPVRPTPQRYFSVWTGAYQDQADTSVPYVKQKIHNLCPWDNAYLEWYVKAGEGGSWQRQFDDHPLAPDSENGLRGLYDNAAHFSLKVVPYVVVRGRFEWEAQEHEQIRACVRATGACVLNLEPGAPYWNGPVTSTGVQNWFNRLAVPPENLFLTAIPRHSAVMSLGGWETMRTWVWNVGGVSWECYGAIADDLRVDQAIPRVREMLPGYGPWYFVPVVNRSEIVEWAGTTYAEPALQVWYLDGD